MCELVASKEKIKGKMVINDNFKNRLPEMYFVSLSENTLFAMKG